VCALRSGTLPASSALSLASAGPFMKLSAVRRLALAGSLSASVALGLQLQHGRDARPFGASVAFAQPRAAGVAMLASPAEGRARLIDGKAIAAAVRRDIKASSDELKAAHGTTPGLAVVLVGNRTDSATYVRMKKKAAAEVGFYSVDRNFDETVTQEQLLATVEELNADPRIHGILVQLPLPRHIDEAAVLESIAVAKDVDGFSAENIGRMCLRGGEPPLALPCTPAGCVELLQRSEIQVAGKEVVVLGRSNIVGMPVAHLLQSMDATVTVCHSRTADLPAQVPGPTLGPPDPKPRPRRDRNTWALLMTAKPRPSRPEASHRRDRNAWPRPCFGAGAARRHRRRRHRTR